MYSKAEADALARGKIKVVTELPAEGEAGCIYYVGPTGTGDDKYEEYIWNPEDGAWVKVGDHSIDLSEYVNSLTQGSGDYVTGVTKSGSALTVTRGTLPKASGTTPKMDGTGDAGKGTTWARADHVHPTDTSRASADALTSHTGNAAVHVTAAERAAWNAKAATSTATASADGLMSKEDKAKLDGVKANANRAATVGSVTSRIQALDVASAGGSGKYISAISQTDGKISATASALSTAPASGSAAPITSGAVYTALAGKQGTMTAITDDEIDAACV